MVTLYAGFGTFKKWCGFGVSVLSVKVASVRGFVAVQGYESVKKRKYSTFRFAEKKGSASGSRFFLSKSK